MGCGASKGVVVPILASDRHKPSGVNEEESERLEAKVRLERIREWARSADPAPWQEIAEAEQRLGLKGAQRPAGARGHAQSGRSLRRERTPETRHGGRANQRGALAQERSKSEPPLESPNASTHVSGGDVQRETPTEPHRRRMSPSYQRPPISAEGLSQGRPALSTEGWDVGEPSVGASEERDRFGGLGKQPLDRGSLSKALKRLHDKIMGKASIQHAFYDFDINHDNKISLDEFFEACSTLKTDLPKEQLSEVFKAMDQNADGFISREEFVKAFEPNLELPRHPTADDLIAAARRKKTAETRGHLVKAKTMDLQHKMIGKNP